MFRKAPALRTTCVQPPRRRVLWASWAESAMRASFENGTRFEMLCFMCVCTQNTTLHAPVSGRGLRVYGTRLGVFFCAFFAHSRQTQNGTS